MSRWMLPAAIGGIWMALGVVLFMNALMDGVRVPPGALVAILALDASVTLIAALRCQAAGRGLLLIKAGVFIAVAIVLLATDGRAEMTIGLLVGGFLIAHATWQGADACRARAAGWSLRILWSVTELLLGVWTLLDYPLGRAIESDVSLLIMNSASILVARAMALRHGGDAGL